MARVLVTVTVTVTMRGRARQHWLWSSYEYALDGYSLSRNERC